MSYRAIPVNWLLDFALALGDQVGLQRKVEVSDHSIDLSLQIPDHDERAWDTNMFRNGNLFVSGYANPIKPRTRHHKDLENPDTVEVEEGDVSDAEDAEGAETADDGPHVELISSSRYRDYMRQDLVSQLLTPSEKWRLLAYGILGVGCLQFFTMIIVLYATGGF